MHKDWQIVKLKEIISLFHNGIWGDSPVQDERSYPVIRSTEITHDGVIDLSNVAVRKIPSGKVDKYILKYGDILLVGSSGSPHLVGRAALFRKSKDNKVYLFSNFMLRLRPKNIDSVFLFYYLSSSKFQHFLKLMQQTSTGLRNLPKREFLEFKLQRPPLPEQQKIAEILSTVDQAIEKIDEAINKTQRLKKGLMQELLTKGIGHKEFKNSEIGRIPKEWEIYKIKNIGNIITGKTPPTKNKIYWNGNIPFITPADIKQNKYINNTERNVSNEGVRRIGYILPKESVVVVCIGSTIGKIGLTSKESVTNQQNNSIVCKKKINPHYVYYALLLRSKILKSFSGIAAVPIINKTLFGNLEIPLPPLPEQQKIAEILSTVDSRLEILRKRKGKLEKIKKGLMNDLLTGRKRVKLDA